MKTNGEKNKEKKRCDRLLRKKKDGKKLFIFLVERKQRQRQAPKVSSEGKKQKKKFKSIDSHETQEKTKSSSIDNKQVSIPIKKIYKNHVTSTKSNSIDKEKTKPHGVKER